MSDELKDYYERELSFLRDMGAEFRDKYPDIAGRLQLTPGTCEDPHVERLLEGVAFLTARVRAKIDDEYPEITDALTGLIFPHYQRPVPSMSIARFYAGAGQAGPPEGLRVAAGARLRTQPAQGQECRFQTIYPVTVWPIDIPQVQLHSGRVPVDDRPHDARALIQLSLRCQWGATFGQLAINQLRFYLGGEDRIGFALYELLLNNLASQKNVLRIEVRGQTEQKQEERLVLSPGDLRPVGFEPDEGVLPRTPQTFRGYALLQEFFAFPKKFLFFDLVNLAGLSKRRFAGSVDLLFFLSQAPADSLTLKPDNFQLGCSPIVNLFRMPVDSIPLTHTQSEYRVVPDVGRPLGYEVFSIDRVVGKGSPLERPIEFQPFYAPKHWQAERRSRTYWHASRRFTLAKEDSGTDVYLSFVDESFHPRNPGSSSVERMYVETTCTNRDLPGRLRLQQRPGDFELLEPEPVGGIACVEPISATLRPALGRGAQWRLISHLTCNQLSAVGADGGLDALRELLLLYDFGDRRNLIEGVTAVSTEPVTGRTRTGAVVGGVQVKVGFDRSKYVGSSAFLLAAVLERFFGTQVSINSFSQLVIFDGQREVRWPPRAGEKTLL
jgi:type VI secretion system protein ImpG